MVLGGWSGGLSVDLRDVTDLDVRFGMGDGGEEQG